MDLLWIIENQWSENPQNEHIRGNLQIECPNEIQIFNLYVNLFAIYQILIFQ